MASLVEARRFAEKHDLAGPGIYVIQPKAGVVMPPIKVGFSTNLARRLEEYRRIWPFGMEIHGVARTANAYQAERIMLKTLAPFVKHKHEWIDAERKSAVMDAWARAHQTIAKGTHHGKNLFTAETLRSGKLPKSFERPPQHRLNTKQTAPRLHFVKGKRPPVPMRLA